MAELKDPKTYVIVNDDGTESGSFKGRQPRPAALKVITELCNDTIIPQEVGSKVIPRTFTLRARGEHKLHIFKGYVEMVKAPENRPAWMPEMVRKPHVEKVGIKKVK